MERFLVLLLLLAAFEALPPAPARSRKFSLEECATMEIAKINHYYYVKDRPINITGIPSDISVHWQTGKIFFTVISNDFLKMKIHYIFNNYLGTIEMADIGQCTTVDNYNDIVYIATDNGVHILLDDGRTRLYTAAGDDVMYLAVNNIGNEMYIATWPQNRVHLITNNGQKHTTFPAIPNGHDLRIDTRNHKYFVAMKTSYILHAGHKTPVKITGLPSNKMTGVFVSRSEKVYGMDESSNLYLIDPYMAAARYLGTFGIKEVNAFGLDKLDNVLIGVKGAIIKYNKMEKSPCALVDSLLPK